MSKKACLLSLSVMGIIFLNFSLTATSLECYKCIGAKKEPHQDAGCSDTTKNCSGAENRCMIRLTRNKLSEPQNYELTCKAQVDCERLGVGCVENNDKTICTKCCSTDLCNSPSTYSATSLECYKCIGAKKEPHQDAGCSDTTKNCSGAENRCMIRLTRNKLSEPQNYELTCKAKVDCERLGVGCVENNDKTICTKCCSTDLCNSPLTYSATSAPSTTLSSGRIQILPIIFLATLTVLWFCD